MTTSCFGPYCSPAFMPCCAWENSFGRTTKHSRITARLPFAVPSNSFPAVLLFYYQDIRQTVFKGNQVLLQQTDCLDDPNDLFQAYLASHDRLLPYNPELWLHADGSIPT